MRRFGGGGGAFIFIMQKVNETRRPARSIIPAFAGTGCAGAGGVFGGDKHGKRVAKSGEKIQELIPNQFPLSWYIQLKDDSADLLL
jgi:hypothetical protein